MQLTSSESELPWLCFVSWSKCLDFYLYFRKTGLTLKVPFAKFSQLLDLPFKPKSWSRYSLPPHLLKSNCFPCILVPQLPIPSHSSETFSSHHFPIPCRLRRLKAPSLQHHPTHPSSTTKYLQKNNTLCPTTPQKISDLPSPILNSDSSDIRGGI